MTAVTLLAFAGLCLLLSITPGPDTFLVLRISLQSAAAGLCRRARLGAGIHGLGRAGGRGARRYPGGLRGSVPLDEDRRRVVPAVLWESPR